MKSGRDFDFSEVRAKLRLFSSDTKNRDDRAHTMMPGTTVPYFRAGCHLWTSHILADLLHEFLAGATFHHYRSHSMPLDVAVRHAVWKYAKDDFDWKKIAAIIKTAGEHHLGPNHLDPFFERFELSALQFQSDRTVLISYREILRLHAVEILWAELLSFLIYDGRFESLLPYPYHRT